MAILSQRTLAEVCRVYHRDFGLRAWHISVSGESLRKVPGKEVIFRLDSSVPTGAYALQEALHWGEPYIFYWAAEVISWVVALVDQHSVHGGIIGGVALSAGKSLEQSVQGLVDQGIAPKLAHSYLNRLPVFTPARMREAALSIQKTFYQISGWKPLLLEENRLKALQQKQISAAIDVHKKRGQTNYPIDKERMLLTLIKAGDRNGARRVLNEMLGAMFLYSPKLVLLRARAIEMMGYLTRAAIEDSPLMEPLIERNHQWMQRLIRARDFETLAHNLMQALDDFMEGIYAHGFNCYNPRVGRVLDFISRNYARPLTLGQVGASIGVSAFRASHLIKTHTGKTVLQHMMRLRVQKARQLLEKTSKSCPDIAYEVGFCDQSYFIKHFKRLLGVTPARYRRTRLMPSRENDKVKPDDSSVSVI